MTLVRDRFWHTLFGVGIVTTVVGFLELSMPEVVLRQLAVDLTTTSMYLLSVVGLMTATFGLMFLYALASTTPQYVAILWSGLQKCSTAALLGIAIQRGIVSNAGLVLALFDLVAGVMIVGYWYWVRQVARESEAVE
jgi:hypothetical protein